MTNNSHTRKFSESPFGTLPKVMTDGHRRFSADFRKGEFQCMSHGPVIL